jgi:hypothetical protein
LNPRGGVQHVVLACLIAGTAALSVVGCGSQADAGLQASTDTINPLEPQRLAIAGDHRLSVVEGRQIQTIAAVPPDSTIEEFAWSGDGHQLGWRDYEEGPNGVASYLTMVDVKTGERHRWQDVYGPIFPGTTGIVVGSYEGRFTQYLPDGQSEEIAVRIPPPHNPERTEPTSTEVLGAVPLEGAWLIAAENSARLAMPADSYRIFRFDPEHPTLIPLLSVRFSWSHPTRLDDDRVVWIHPAIIDTCRNADRLAGYRVRPPPLPSRPDHRSWRISKVIVDDGAIEALARGTGPPHEDRPGYEEKCERGERSFHWLSLRNGAWVDRGEGLVELDVSDDGRVARIEGGVCDPYSYGLPSGCEGGSEGEGEYESLRYDAALLDFPDGSHLPLPAWVREVKFSPGTPISVKRTVGYGPAINDTLTLDSDGIGSLRFGSTPSEMEAGTASALRFEVDHSGCGTVELADATANRELGVQGRLAGGRLVAITVSTLDSPVDETHAPLSEVQPDVSAIKPRGPRTNRGVRAGDNADRLLRAYGTPSETNTEPETETTAYVFDADGARLAAIVDGGATVRRLELSKGEWGPCGG